MKEAIA